MKSYDKRTWRGAFATCVWGGLAYSVMAQAAQLDDHYMNICDKLQLDVPACSANLAPNIALTYFLAHIGCIAVAVFAWRFAPFTSGWPANEDA